MRSKSQSSVWELTEVLDVSHTNPAIPNDTIGRAELIHGPMAQTYQYFHIGQPSWVTYSNLETYQYSSDFNILEHQTEYMDSAGIIDNKYNSIYNYDSNALLDSFLFRRWDFINLWQSEGK